MTTYFFDTPAEQAIGYDVPTGAQKIMNEEWKRRCPDVRSMIKARAIRIMTEMQASPHWREAFGEWLKNMDSESMLLRCLVLWVRGVEVDEITRAEIENVCAAALQEAAHVEISRSFPITGACSDGYSVFSFIDDLANYHRESKA